MAEKSGGAEDFEISRIFSRTFHAIGSNPVLYLAVALVLGAGPTFMMRWLENGQGDAGTYLLVTAKIEALGLPFLAIFVLNIFASAILMGALTRATLLSLAGERPNFDRSLEPAVGMVFPLVGMGIVTGLGIGLAALLLIVPGIMLWVTWSVAVPAFVEERRGILQSLDRSSELTKGARWKIFAVMLIVYVVLITLQIGVGVVNRGLTAAMNQPWLPALLTAIVTALGTMTTLTLHASIYAELRDVKEGGGAGDLEAVFA